jgi:hypothetical protein
MTIRPKWFRDICSVLFSAYYLVWANEGDEVVRTVSVAITGLSRLRETNTGSCDVSELFAQSRCFA